MAIKEDALLYLYEPLDLGDPPFTGQIRILSNDNRNRFQHQQQQQPQLKILKRPNQPQTAQPDSQVILLS